jgi:ABC-type antimicrobial peptide transport system ATPase subunit
MVRAKAPEIVWRIGTTKGARLDMIGRCGPAGASHNLNVVRMMGERMIVLQAGQIVEEGSSEDLFRQPKTEYTAALLAAIPHFEQRHGIFRSALEEQSRFI